jgi:SAM-dependent methyltransferase
VYYYRHDLALIHDRGHGQQADRCAPGIIELLAPVRGGVVLELGCGSGALTRHLLSAGFQVIATDASPDMLALARASLGPDADLRRITLPEDPLPAADAVVSVGHAISYVADAAAVDRALVAMAGALRPGGVLAFDLLDLAFGRVDPGRESSGRVAEDWAVITQYSRPAPDRFVREASAACWSYRVAGGFCVLVGRKWERWTVPGTGWLRDRVHGAGEGVAAVAVVAEVAEAGRGGRQEDHAIGLGPPVRRRHRRFQVRTVGYAREERGLI